MALTNKQKMFIVEYTIDFNATQAAIRAGYSKKTAQAIGTENLSKPVIKQAIEDKIDELIMSADEFAIRLSQQAKFDLSQYSNYQNEVDVQKIKEAGLGHMISGFEFDRDGRKIVKFYNGQKALELIGKVHAKFTDVTLKVEKELEDALVKLESRLSEDEFEKVISILSE